MGRSTDIERLQKLIGEQPDQSIAKREINGLLGWDLVKAQRVLDRALADPACDIQMVKGGKSVLFRGSEHRGGSRGTGLYNDVAKQLEGTWGKRQHFRDVEVHFTSNAKLREGHEWLRPDLVMECHPGKRTDPNQPKRLHAIEVEVARAFGLRSVYQAHAQGQGADYRWVMFRRSGPDPDRPNNGDWDRIEALAKELNVGLVGFAKATSADTWVTYREARWLKPSERERAVFEKRVGPPR